MRFEDIGGLEEEKRRLREIVILPFSRPELFSRGKLLRPPKGVLLYGPPGTGKTMASCNLPHPKLKCATANEKFMHLTHELYPDVIPSLPSVGQGDRKGDQGCLHQHQPKHHAR